MRNVTVWSNACVRKGRRSCKAERSGATREAGGCQGGGGGEVGCGPDVGADDGGGDEMPRTARAAGLAISTRQSGSTKRIGSGKESMVAWLVRCARSRRE